MPEEKIPIVYCARLELDEQKGETYCSLGKDHYPKKCGSPCPDFVIKEE